MGLLDVINGMQNGPRGQPQPGAGASGGMSPMTMALLGLLAYKAVKSFSGGTATPSPAPSPRGTTAASDAGGGGLGGLLGGLFGGGTSGAASGGSLNDLIPGGLGGLLGGGAAGGVLTSGLGNLVRDFQNSGQGRAVQSWVGTGPNQPITPEALESAIGSDALDALAKKTGMSRDDLLEGLAQHLPGLVDHLTPQGRLPTEQETSRMM
jgi:uncharacterized protein YidB (DUF937 family)